MKKPFYSWHSLAVIDQTVVPHHVHYVQSETKFLSLPSKLGVTNNRVLAEGMGAVVKCTSQDPLMFFPPSEWLVGGKLGMAE